MSKAYIISGSYNDDNLALIVNSNDSDVNISIDYLSGTDDFRRASYELSLDEQIALAKALLANATKWNNQ